VCIGLGRIRAPLMSSDYPQAPLSLGLKLGLDGAAVAF
jgi:hypothetical protein